MNNKTLGTTISSLRKEKNMTQLQLAQLMNVTDKAVSKWERDLSCPDINSLPKLAECLGVSVNDLMQVKSELNDENKTEIVNKDKIKNIVNTSFKAVCVAMGIAVVVLSVLGELEITDGITMLGVGLACAGVSLLNNN